MKANRLGSRLTAFASIGLIVAVNGGCGVVLTHGPPDGHEQMDYFACTESNVGPALDAVTVLGYLILAGAYGSQSSGSGGGMTADGIMSDLTTDSNIVAALVAGAAYGLSAGVGFSKTAKCRAAIRDLKARHAQRAATVSVPVPPELIVQTVVLEPDTFTLAVGERLRLSATAYNYDGDAVPHRVFSWSSSNDAIASVSSTGLVTAHASGAVVIAARTDNVVGTAEIAVVSR
jgi:uncharacterized protein YjdB